MGAEFAGFIPMTIQEDGNVSYNLNTTRGRSVVVTRGSGAIRYAVRVPAAPLSSKVDHVDALVAEVQRNGCGDQLVTPDGICQVSIARSYQAHPFHTSIGAPLNDGELLALVLYTSCDCNYAMTRCHLSDDYETWTVFDYTLSMAIGILSWHSRCQEVPLFTGLANVVVEPKHCGKGSVFLKCHMSTSTQKQVAEAFRGDQGVLIAIPPQIASREWYLPEGSANFGVMAPVAWISKFGDNEAEVIYSRFSWYPWQFQEVSRTNGLQELAARYMYRGRLADVGVPGGLASADQGVHRDADPGSARSSGSASE